MNINKLKLILINIVRLTCSHMTLKLLLKFKGHFLVILVDPSLLSNFLNQNKLTLIHYNF